MAFVWLVTDVWVQVLIDWSPTKVTTHSKYRKVVSGDSIYLDLQILNQSASSSSLHRRRRDKAAADSIIAGAASSADPCNQSTHQHGLRMELLAAESRAQSHRAQLLSSKCHVWYDCYMLTSQSE